MDRPYQTAAIKAIQGHHQKVRSTLLVLATGLGKTRIFCRLAQQTEGRVLILAHRDELISQAADAVTRLTGESVEIEQAELRAHGSRIVVGSVQSLCRQKRLQRYRSDAFALVVIDEAHRSCATSYRKILAHFSEAKILGVTATPDRTDKKAMGKVFESVCYRMDIDAGVKEGWLCPLKGERITMESCNLDLIPVRSGDLATDILDEAILKEAEFVITELFARSCGSTILFTPGVRSARYIAERMNFLFPGVAVCVDGKQDDDERREAIARYKSGRCQFLINCMVATEGFDAPITHSVGVLRPTKSRSLYAQMIGRGTRTEPGCIDNIDTVTGRRDAIARSTKPHANIIDFVGVGTVHKLVGPVDILGGGYDEAEKAVAKKVMEEKGNTDIYEALDLARARLMAAVAQIKSAQYVASRATFDPFEALGLTNQQELPGMRREPVGARQVAFLEKKGVTPEAIKTMSREAANKLIRSIIVRDGVGAASLKQLQFLHAMGIREKRVGKSQAAWMLTEMTRLSPSQRTPDAIRQIIAMSKRKGAA